MTAEDQASRRAPGQRKSRALDRELYEAANAGDFDGVKEMLEAGANPSAKIEGDGSPLIGAARSGRGDITKLLLDQGADPNGVVEGDGSPLINGGGARPARSGADADRSRRRRESRCRRRREPADERRRAGPPRIVQLLVEKGADIHARILTSGIRVAANGGRPSARRGRTVTRMWSGIWNRAARESRQVLT